MAEQTDDTRKPSVDNSAPDDRSGSGETGRQRPLPRIKPGWTLKGL